MDVIRKFDSLLHGKNTSFHSMARAQQGRMRRMTLLLQIKLSDSHGEHMIAALTSLLPLPSQLIHKHGLLIAERCTRGRPHYVELRQRTQRAQKRMSETMVIF